MQKVAKFQDSKSDEELGIAIDTGINIRCLLISDEIPHASHIPI